MYIQHLQFLVTLLLISYVSGIGYSLILFKNFTNALILTPLVSYTIISLASFNLNYLALNTRGFSIPLITSISIISILITIFIINKRKVVIHKEWSIFITITFSLVNALIILSPSILHNSFNFLNDHTSYNILSQYLQENSFVKKADIIAAPWTDNVLLYQEKKLRMGSSFYTATISSLFNQNSSLILYPAITAFAEYLLTSSLAVLLIHLRKSRLLLLIGLLLLLVTTWLNHYLLLLGFLPQTIGIAITMVLIQVLINTINLNKLNVSSFLINTLLTASLIATYQEVVPFHFLISGLVVVIYFATKKLSFRTSILILLSYLLSFIISPPSFINAVQGIIFQSKGIVGWYQDTTLLQYFLEIFGLSPTTADYKLLMFVLIGGVIFLYKYIRSNRDVSHTIILFFGCGYLLIITYFRLATTDPFQNIIGNTWSIYKTFQWSYWIFLIIFANAIFAVFQKSIFGKLLVILFMTVLFKNFLSNFKWLRYEFATKSVIDSISASVPPLEEYSRVKFTRFKPANLFFTDQHPNIAQLPLSILGDSSIGIFLAPDNSQSYTHNPLYSSPNKNYYNWIYQNNPQVSSQKSIAKLAGYNIYPPTSNVIYFNNSFIQTSDILQFTKTSDTGRARFFNSGDVNTHLVSKVITQCPVTISFNKKTTTINQPLGKPITVDWGSYPPGLHQIIISKSYLSDCSEENKQVQFNQLTFSPETSRPPHDQLK